MSHCVSPLLLPINRWILLHGLQWRHEGWCFLTLLTKEEVSRLDHEGSMGGSHWKPSLGIGTGVGPKHLWIREIVLDLGDRRKTFWEALGNRQYLKFSFLSWKSPCQTQISVIKETAIILTSVQPFSPFSYSWWVLQGCGVNKHDPSFHS